MQNRMLLNHEVVQIHLKHLNLLPILQQRDHKVHNYPILEQLNKQPEDFRHQEQNSDRSQETEIS
jgi:hypothetical protein